MQLNPTFTQPVTEYKRTRCDYKRKIQVMFNRLFRKLMVNAVINLIVAAFRPIPILGAAIHIISMAI